MDSPVIKNPLGVPYIPGSSLKGKLRSLLAAELNGAENESEDDPKIKKLFGFAGQTKAEGVKTRLIIRDADLDKDAFKDVFKEDEAVLETEFTQEKAENSIDRKSGKAANPRFIERVPADSVFNFEMVLNNFEEDKNENFIDLIKTGIQLLNDDYLGGSGTRGYGKVKIESNIDNPETKTY